MSPDSTSFWLDKRVLVTGHTGFKGAWLSLLLASQKANVFGVGLKPDSHRGLYANLKNNIHRKEFFVDLRDEFELKNAIREIDPDIVFHLAAQASVLEGYRKPFETWTSNLSGTLNLIKELDSLGRKVTVVITTTDKVYRNSETGRSFNENDPIGGTDPYSLSKVAVEHLVSSYKASVEIGKRKLRIATARAGNVIGGGDWLKHRIVPDVLRAVEDKVPVLLRNPNAIRPWQHVLDPIHGYLLLAERLSADDGLFYEKAYNFANNKNSGLTVLELVQMIGKRYPLEIQLGLSENAPQREANILLLNSERSLFELGWQPKLDMQDSIDFTLDWYHASLSNSDMFDFTNNQIAKYETYVR